jgi:DNA helicase-2/ATP-dependent DNA helicase PcrA
MNLEQLAAATSTAPRIAVIAGPGSGKTTTLVAAVAAKCRESGPQSVICITFTVAGAAEMKARLAKVPPEQGGPFTSLGYCGTLHAFLLKLLREHHKLSGLPRNIAVVDDDAVEALLLQTMEAMGAKTSTKKMLEKVSDSKLITGMKLSLPTKEDLVVIELHRQLKREGLLTLDALLVYGLRLIKMMAEQNVGNFPYKHLFVDEAQDSGDVDFAIYNLMPCATKFMVGDPDQSIYGFRGAKPANFVSLAAPRSAWNYELHYLETNYRCRMFISQAAQFLIEKNSLRIQKRTVAAHQGGAVEAFACGNPIAEMNLVANLTIQKYEGGKSDEQPDTAVLCRTNRQAREFADFLKSLGVPVAVDERPVEPADWRTAKLVVAALAAPHSDMAWLAMVEALRGEKFAQEAKANARRSMRSVKDILMFMPQFKEHTLPAFLNLLSLEARERLHDACRELSVLGEWTLGDLSAYLRSSERREVRKPGVHVGTVHSVKGREFDCVIMVGMEEGNFPQAKKDTDIEEERRLCFVGMTRARHRLVMTWSKFRPQNRGPNLPPGPLEAKEPSRFLKEAGL